MHDAMSSQPHLAAHGRERLKALLAMTAQQHSQLVPEPQPSMTSALHASLFHQHQQHSQNLPGQYQHKASRQPSPPEPSSLSHSAPIAAPQHMQPLTQTGPNMSGMSPVDALKHGLLSQDSQGFLRRPLPAASQAAAHPQPAADADPMEEDPEDFDDEDLEGAELDEEADYMDNLEEGDDEDGQDGDIPSTQPERMSMDDRQAYYAPVPRPSVHPEASTQPPAHAWSGAREPGSGLQGSSIGPATHSAAGPVAAASGSSASHRGAPAVPSEQERYWSEWSSTSYFS